MPIKPETAKLKLTHDPQRGEKAWLCHFENQNSHWIPKYYIIGYTPATKTIEIETFILKEKGINFKVS